MHPNTLLIYPNPTGDFFRLNKVSDIEIYNLNGQGIKSLRNVQVVDVEDINPGLYFVKDAEGKVAKLIVK